MELIINGSQIKDFKGFVFCDTDFLSLLSGDENFLEKILELFSDKLILDPFTQIEFLRDVFLPKQRFLKEQIIKKAFIVAESHQEIFARQVSSSLELSRIYAHQKKGIGASLVDLLLAGRLMNATYQAYLITGNAKDFPSIVFDTVSIINFEQNDGTMRAISILKFNDKKYSLAQSRYAEILKK